MYKKILSVCLSILMVFNLYSGAMAYGRESSAVILAGNMTFEAEKTADGTFILTGYLNGKPYDRATIKMGSDTIYYQKLEERDNFSEESDTNEPQIYHLSDIITVKKGEPSKSRASYVIKRGDIGSFIYKTSYEKATINFNSKFVKSVDGDFDIRAGAGLAASVVITAIVAGFSYAITASLGTSILFALTSKISEGTVVSAFSSHVTGNCYLYNITSTKDDGTRTITKAGETYYGTVLRDGKYVDGVEVYGDVYPEFIKKRDHATASYFMSYYAVDPYTIIDWNPK